MACIYLLKIRGGPQSLDSVITTYKWLKITVILRVRKLDRVVNIQIFLNLEGTQHLMNGSKVTAILPKGGILTIGRVASVRIFHQRG